MQNHTDIKTWQVTIQACLPKAALSWPTICTSHRESSRTDFRVAESEPRFAQPGRSHSTQSNTWSPCRVVIRTSMWIIHFGRWENRNFLASRRFSWYRQQNSSLVASVRPAATLAMLATWPTATAGHCRQGWQFNEDGAASFELQKAAFNVHSSASYIFPWWQRFLPKHTESVSACVSTTCYY